MNKNGEKTLTTTEYNQIVAEKERSTARWAVITGIIAMVFFGLIIGLMTGFISWGFMSRQDAKDISKIVEEYRVIPDFPTDGQEY